MNIIKAGDTMKLLESLPENSVDAIITRLPRPQKSEKQSASFDDSPLTEGNYPHWLRSLMYKAWFVLKENGNVLFQVQSSAVTAPGGDWLGRARAELHRGGWFECEKFVWCNDAGRLLQNMGPWRQYEEILWFRKNNSVTQYRIERKDAGLYESLVGTFTQSGQIVLDPFAGMGDIVVTAHKMGRKFIAFEQDADTVTALNLRIRTLSSLDTGETEEDG